MTHKGWSFRTFRRTSAIRFRRLNAPRERRGGARVQTTGRPAKVAGDHAPQRLPGSSRSRMICQRAASPARGFWATRASCSRARFGRPGARRASARRDLITPSLAGTLGIAGIFAVMVCPPWPPTLVFSGGAGHPRLHFIGELWTCDVLAMETAWRRPCLARQAVTFPGPPVPPGQATPAAGEYWLPPIFRDLGGAGQPDPLPLPPAAGPGMLDHPSLTELLPSGIFMANDDYNHRMAAIDPATGALAWRYGITGKPGAAPGELNTPRRLRPAAAGRINPDASHDRMNAARAPATDRPSRSNRRLRGE